MELLDKIREAGVIGAGGAGFPTHVKLKADADFILLNGAECEPLLRVDQQLMAAHPQEVIGGLILGQKITGASQAIIGIKESHPDVIDIMNQAIKELGVANDVRVATLPDVYPAGDEQVLVYELTGRIVPETGIPIAVGCVVMNVETAFNVWKASQGHPVTMKYVTVAGDVPHPITACVPVGTPLIDVLRLSGRSDFSDVQIIDGGPMMGPLLEDMNGFVTKKTKGLVVLPKDHKLIRKKSRTMDAACRLDRSACEQCRMCTDLCPRHLLGHSTVPHKMVRALAYGLPADENLTPALTCSQCSLCEYFSCPSGINPKMANVYYMGQLRKQGIRHAPKTEFQAHPMRQYRMVPSRRLIARLNLAPYNVAAPLNEQLEMQSALLGFALNKHVGAPAVPLVSAGERVTAGQKIAEIAEGKLGACVHASVDGTVEAIEGNTIIVRRD